MRLACCKHVLLMCRWRPYCPASVLPSLGRCAAMQLSPVLAYNQHQQRRPGELTTQEH